MGLKKIAAALAMVLLLSGVTGGCAAKSGSYNLSASWCQEVADNIKAIQPVDIPGSLAQDGGMKTGGEFDINEYFPILKHLSIKNGYMLDYFYHAGGSSGTPVLYTRQKNEKPFVSYYEYGNAGNTVTRPENDVSIIWLVKDKDGKFKYGNHVRMDKSSESYFEYAVLQLLGGQFYLFAKANIYDIRIVCEDSRVEDILAEIENSGMAAIDEDFKAAARSLELEPVVTIEEKTATVSLVVFTKWGGFSKVTYTMSRDYPHSITGYTNENLLKYDCGIEL